MSTITKARKIQESDPVSQGNVYKNVKYSYLDSESDEFVNIIEYEFPLAIIVSQACDVTSMNDLQETGLGKATKFMPSILMCPIYDKNSLHDVNHLSDFVTNELFKINKETFFTSKDINLAENDMHYRFHVLNVKIADKLVMNDAVIDNKHFFTVSPSYLFSNKFNRVFTLENLFAEQVTLKFASYLARVAIP